MENNPYLCTVKSYNSMKQIKTSVISVEEINKKLQDILFNGSGLKHYAKYGDVGCAELYENGTLFVAACGKAYGDGHEERGMVKQLSDEEYSRKAPRFFTNFRGEDDVTDVDIEYAANSIVRDIRRMGGAVKNIEYKYEWD